MSTMVEQVTAALGIMQEWLGEGGAPVPQVLSNARASVCVTCPKNKHGKWWERAGKNAIAMTMRAHLEAKNAMAISVPDEDLLNLCEVCGCAIPLKVHVPLKHILAHTKPEVLAAFPKTCWVPVESL